MPNSEAKRAYMREYMKRRRANGSSSSSDKAVKESPDKSGTARTNNKQAESIQEILPLIALGIVAVGIVVLPILIIRYSATKDDTKEKE